MRIDIKKNDCKFYVNEEERTIVCVIHCDKYLVEYYVNELTHNYFWLPFNEREKIKMPSTFIGKAVCTENDTWDEELGRDIAFERAKDKFYKSFFKRANRLIEMIDGHVIDMIDSFNNIGTKVEKRMGELRKNIEERVGEGE